jgi:hypothetical protein
LPISNFCEVDYEENSFNSRSFFIRYKNEEHELNDGVHWSLSVPILKSEFLNYESYNDNNDGDDADGDNNSDSVRNDDSNEMGINTAASGISVNQNNNRSSNTNINCPSSTPLDSYNKRDGEMFQRVIPIRLKFELLCCEFDEETVELYGSDDDDDDTQFIPSNDSIFYNPIYEIVAVQIIDIQNIGTEKIVNNSVNELNKNSDKVRMNFNRNNEILRVKKCIHEYYAIKFDRSHSVQLDCMIHASISGISYPGLSIPDVPGISYLGLSCPDLSNTDLLFADLSKENEINIRAVNHDVDSIGNSKIEEISMNFEENKPKSIHSNEHISQQNEELIKLKGLHDSLLLYLMDYCIVPIQNNIDEFTHSCGMLLDDLNACDKEEYFDGDSNNNDNNDKNGDKDTREYHNKYEFDDNDRLKNNEEIYNGLFKELSACKNEKEIITFMKKSMNTKNKENKFQWLIFKSKLASKMNHVKCKLKIQYHRDMQVFWGRHMIRQTTRYVSDNCQYSVHKCHVCM